MILDTNSIKKIHPTSTKKIKLNMYLMLRVNPFYKMICMKFALGLNPLRLINAFATSLFDLGLLSASIKFWILLYSMANIF